MKVIFSLPVATIVTTIFRISKNRTPFLLPSFLPLSHHDDFDCNICLRLILAREDVTRWKALYMHEYDGEGIRNNDTVTIPPISEVTQTFNEKLELKESQSPVMSKIMINPSSVR